MDVPSSSLDPVIAARLKRDRAGLVAAVVQQHDTGEVLMVGWMDDEALHRTLTSGRTTFYSRSRQQYWVKGETSGNRQWVREVLLDCDGDALLVRDLQLIGAWLARGEQPACVEACTSGALTFGDLEDPHSEVRHLLHENFTIRRKPGLGTRPEVYYIIDDPRTLQEVAPAAVVDYGTTVDGFGFYFLPYTINQNSGPTVDIPNFLNSKQPVNDAEDAEAYLVRLAAVDGANHVILLEAGLGGGALWLHARHDRSPGVGEIECLRHRRGLPAEDVGEVAPEDRAHRAVERP